MGIAQSEIGAMSLWVFVARVNGWNDAHGGKGSVPAVTTEDMIRKREKQRLENGGG